jgi:alpha-tubulin suppressor-like RCC1 family protein
LTFTALRAGAYHVCGLTSNGSAYCWGDNESGQLGDGSYKPSAKPTPVAGN